MKIRFNFVLFIDTFLIIEFFLSFKSIEWSRTRRQSTVRLRLRSREETILGSPTKAKYLPSAVFFLFFPKSIAVVLLVISEEGLTQLEQTEPSLTVYRVPAHVTITCQSKTRKEYVSRQNGATERPPRREGSCFFYTVIGKNISKSSSNLEPQSG